MSEEHTIAVKSVQEYRGEFDSSFIVDGELAPGALEMEMHQEISLTFKCSCGRRFRKVETVKEHLIEQAASKP